MYKKIYKPLIAGIVLTPAILVSGCANSKDYPEPQTHAKDIEITIPEKRDDGQLKMIDADGREYLQYNGKIHINNDGSDGNPIDIVIYTNESEGNEFN